MTAQSAASSPPAAVPAPPPAAAAAPGSEADPEKAKLLTQAVAEQVRSLAGANTPILTFRVTIVWY